MKIFLDTNVILEHLLHREQFESVESLILSAGRGEHEFFISTASLYTIVYVLEKELKNSLPKKERISILRCTLESLLALFQLSNPRNDEMMNAIKDLRFDDIEDSFQYRSALSLGCDLFITFNIKDFNTNSGEKPAILSPIMACKILVQ